MKKRILAIFMSLAIAVAFMPTLAFADDAAATDPAPKSAAEIQAEIDALQAQIKALQDQLEQEGKTLGDLQKELEALQKDKDAADAAEKEAAEAAIQEAADKYDKVTSSINDLIAQINNLILEQIQKLDLSGYADQIDEVQALVNKIVDAAQDGTLDDVVTEYGTQLDDMISGLEAIQTLSSLDDAAKAELVGAIDDLDAAKDAIRDAAAAYAAGDMTQDELNAALADAQATMDAALDALDGVLETELAEQVQAFIGAANEWADAQGIDINTLDALLAQADALAALIDEYKDMEPSEFIDALIEEAKAAYEANADAIAEAIQGTVDAAIAQVMDMYANGELDQVIDTAMEVMAAATGLDKADIQALAEDFIAYATNAESFQDVSAARDALVAEKDALASQLTDLQADLAALTAKNADLEAQLAAAKALAAKKAKLAAKRAKAIKAFKKKWNNAMKIKKAKPAIKKPTSKKKKVTVKWKKFKKATATGFQISYKVGKKKAKFKKVKGAKKVKAITKKLKKGKKVTVKVRAYYVMKYNGKSHTFYSKWSKAKKIKVKK